MKKTIINFLINFAYFLGESYRYQRTKEFFNNLLNNDDYPLKKYFDVFMIVIILSSISILILDVKETQIEWYDYYDKYIVTSIFITEYILRLWVHDSVHLVILEEYEDSKFFKKEFDLKKVIKKVIKNKWEYISSFSAIIDLIAILPSYRELRVLRIFILFRAFKLLRYSKSLSNFMEIIQSKKGELYTLLLLLSFFILLASVMIYVFEGNGKNPNISNYFDAVYWSLVTITTVGFGDISPVTTEGRAVTMLIIISGIGTISFLTSIITTAFNERMHEVKENRAINYLSKKSDVNIICGFGELGEIISKKLADSKENFLIIDNNEENIKKAESFGYYVLKSDATKRDIFLKINLKRARSIICTANSEMVNLFIAINIRSISKDIEIIARCKSEGFEKKLRMIGVNHIIVPEKIVGTFTQVYIKRPVAFEALQVILSKDKRVKIEEIEIKKNHSLNQKDIKEFFKISNDLILMGIIKQKNKKYKPCIINYDGLVFEEFDVLVVLGYEVNILDFKKRLNKHGVIKKS